jgi:hypothetical protein
LGERNPHLAGNSRSIRVYNPLTNKKFCAINSKTGKKYGLMNKKDIYEHLANIYLDASLTKKKKAHKYSNFKTLVYIGAPIISLFAILLFFTPLKNNPFFANLSKNKPRNSQLALVISADTAKINFNFDPAKKEIYSIDLNKLNLTTFNTLGFSARKSNYQDTIRLRIEFTNIFKEKSEVYIKDVPYRWQDYKINFSEFKKIADWRKMLNLSFIVEEWNVVKKKGVVYIDNIRLIK